MPDNNERITTFSQKEVTEMQQGFVQELKEVHNNAYALYLKYKDVPGLGKDLLKHMGIIYNKEAVIQKDINIEASDCESNNASN